MGTMKLSKTLETALNTQIAKEAYASQIFLSYASWAERHGYSGIANFLFRHSQEERNNMIIIIDYILKRGSEVTITAIPAPPENPENINTCLEEVNEIEEIYTKGIHGIIKMSADEKDWAAHKFIQWFLKEQIEEETFAKSLLNRMEKETVSTNENSLFGTNIRLQNPNINLQQQ
jgi:ferritin